MAGSLIGLYLIQSAETGASSLAVHREELWAASNLGRGTLPSITGLTEAETGQEGHSTSSLPWLLATAPDRKFSYSMSIFIFYFICKNLIHSPPWSLSHWSSKDDNKCQCYCPWGCMCLHTHMTSIPAGQPVGASLGEARDLRSRQVSRQRLQQRCPTAMPQSLQLGCPRLPSQVIPSAPEQEEALRGGGPVLLPKGTAKSWAVPQSALET